MTTAEKEAPTSVLVAPRTRKKSGMLTSGIAVFVGLEKSGKSAILASSGAYVIELDPGDADHLDGRIHDIVPEYDDQGNITKSALEVFRAVYSAALRDDSIDTIGIDTFGTFVELQAQEIAEAAGLASITDRKKDVNSYALWDELGDRIERFIESMRRSGKLFLIAAHSKSPELDDEKKVVVPMGIDTYKKPSSMLAKRADMIGYTYKREVGGSNEYRVTFRGGPLGAWGSRVDALNDKEIKLSKDNPWGSLVAAANGQQTQQQTATTPAPAAAAEKSAGKPAKRR
jgi:hypothetical protein